MINFYKIGILTNSNCIQELEYYFNEIILVITVYDEIERTAKFWKIDQKYRVFVLFRHDY